MPGDRAVQELAGGTDPRIGGVEVDLEALGDLGHGHVLEVGEHEGHALVLVHGVEGVVAGFRRAGEASQEYGRVASKAGDQATAWVREQGALPDHLIAWGGGSNIDLAKALCVTIPCGRPVAELVGHANWPAPPLPLVAVPTTAGTR